jgi:hypothetical protein
MQTWCLAIFNFKFGGGEGVFLFQVVFGVSIGTTIEHEIQLCHSYVYLSLCSTGEFHSGQFFLWAHDMPTFSTSVFILWRIFAFG